MCPWHLDELNWLTFWYTALAVLHSNGGKSGPKSPQAVYVSLLTTNFKRMRWADAVEDLTEPSACWFILTDTWRSEISLGSALLPVEGWGVLTRAGMMDWIWNNLRGTLPFYTSCWPRCLRWNQKPLAFEHRFPGISDSANLKEWTGHDTRTVQVVCIRVESSAEVFWATHIAKKKV
jgi:hypothetical protein